MLLNQRYSLAILLCFVPIGLSLRWTNSFAGVQPWGRPALVRSTVMDDSNDESTSLNAMQARLGLKDSEVKRIVKQVPDLASCAFHDLALTALQNRLRLNDKDLKAVVLRLPQVLCYDDYEVAMAPGLDALQARLQLNDAELTFLVKKLPQMIGLDFAVAIEPSIQAVQEKDGLDREALKEFILAKPSELLKAGVVVRGGAPGSRKA